MGLSVFQSLAIAGGKAAEIIKSEDIRRSKEYNAAFNKFIDNNVGALKTASAKQKLVLNKAKKDISQIVSTYLGNRDDLSDSVKYEIANVMYASHGYKMENLTRDAQNRLQQYKYENPGIDLDAQPFDYADAFIQNATNIESERTLDQIAKKHAQEIAPMPVLDLAGKAVGLGKYKETAFVDADTKKIESDLISATGYTPDMTIPEGPSINMIPKGLDLAKMQDFKLKEKRIANIIETKEQNDLKFEAYKKGLSRGDFDTADIKNLIKSSESQQYAKLGIIKGVDAQGYFTPKEGAEKLATARMDGFKVAVQQIVNAKNPLVGVSYIKNSDIRNELAGYAKGLKAITGGIDKQTKKRVEPIKEIGGVYERRVQSGTTNVLGRRVPVYKTERYIYLGENIDDIIVEGIS
jgi:hypothetical protein